MNQVLKATACTAALFIALLIPAMLSWALASLAILALSAQPAYPQSRSGQELFQQALAMERSQGKLVEAIALYRRVVTEHAADRALAARALLQLARCQERLGRDQARETYERIVREYAEQTEPASQARMRLQRYAKTAEQSAQAPAFSKVADLPDRIAGVATDGRYIVIGRFVDKSQATFIEIRDLQTGRTWALTKPESGLVDRWPVLFTSRTAAPLKAGGGRLTEELVIFTRLANGRSQMSSEEWRTKTGLFAVKLDGTGERRLADALSEGADSGGVCQVLPPAPNNFGRMLIRCNQGASFISKVISVPEGKIVAELPPATSAGYAPIFVAPGGQHVVSHESGDIFVSAFDGSARHALVEHPATELVGSFTRDAKHFCYMSDRTGAMETWCQPMDGLKPAGEPVRLSGVTRPPNSSIAGFDYETNRLFVVQTHRLDGVSLGTLDRGKLVKPLSPASHIRGTSHLGGWSADGKTLFAIQSLPGTPQPSSSILATDANTGKFRTLPVPEGMSRVRGLRASPNGRTVAVFDQSGAFAVDLLSGQSTSLKLSGVYDLQWCRDALYASVLGPSRRLVRLDPSTGEAATILEDPALSSIACTATPGQVIAAFVFKEPYTPGEHAAHVLIDVNAKTRGKQIAEAEVLTLLPDEKNALIVTGKGNEHWLWNLDLASGEKSQLADLSGHVTAVAAHPGGKEFAIDIVNAPSKNDLWVFSNVFPGAAVKQPAKAQ